MTCILEDDEAYDDIQIKLICHQAFDLRLDKLLSHKLGLSRSQVKSLCQKGIIRTVDGANVLKEKIRNDLRLRIKTKQ